MAVFEGSFTQTGDLRFAIVIGRFNDLITSKLLEGCQDCLKRHGVDVDLQGTQVDYVWVPGSFEVPLVARQMALMARYDAIICLGAVIRGQTPHFDYVAAEVAKGIASVGYQTGTPVIFGIITADTLQQALERAGIKSNKGWDYAMSAIEMAALMRQLRHQTTNIVPNPNFPDSSSTQTLPPSTLSASSQLPGYESSSEPRLQAP
ncbi:6,7-dimethyl-8-ribityllumazine synthase [Leptolyngbya sp. 'hensonii']|uniref:6,7-dimethyl-8-ribityllumazine synthase n=1 Tax=Leptolyngbya sp. 'hensonii' TaxID=1922337 RepID=UPI00094FA132|nr:6,7-dimethyl-8-ribityllumazine synthase [Leptolyngbya sp. 'hensonii']OLP20130.1 6,7-dimethyl-8-ribityllumazine synthase [Leptolyngbya sp. 'hensonii']